MSDSGDMQASRRTGFVDLSRRAALTSALAAGALATLPGRSHATEPANAINRQFPRTGERVPVIGLGTFQTFDLIPGAPRERLRQVLEVFWRQGGRVVDTSPLYGSAETTVGDFAADLGFSDRMFVSNKVWSTGAFLGDADAAEASLDLSRQRLWRERVDLMSCHSLVNVDVILPLLRAWKAEGHVGQVGVTHHEVAYYDVLTSWIERDVIDAVQVRYSIATRDAERRLLRAAADRGVAVLVNMPFEKARLFALVGDRPVPPFARELGIETWAAYFLKWIAAHPAVTVVLPATSDPSHQIENSAALSGSLPDERTRERMYRYVASIPGFADLEKRSWYPGKQYPGLVNRAQAANRARLMTDVDRR